MRSARSTKPRTFASTFGGARIGLASRAGRGTIVSRAICYQSDSDAIARIPHGAARMSLPQRVAVAQVTGSWFVRRTGDSRSRRCHQLLGQFSVHRDEWLAEGAAWRLRKAAGLAKLLVLAPGAGSVARPSACPATVVLWTAPSSGGRARCPEQGVRGMRLTVGGDDPLARSTGLREVRRMKSHEGRA